MTAAVRVQALVTLAWASKRTAVSAGIKYGFPVHFQDSNAGGKLVSQPLLRLTSSLRPRRQGWGAAYKLIVRRRPGYCCAVLCCAALYDDFPHW